ncbi:hypothetical protein CRE_26270 [Caenorhabditis remanei]|uniref:Uncharacterized protein n=1 Tax=Caenorhabditis remanei TaxID=31234 RepID=E3LR31_CAERE|nr:hypothetical protein CRE_26270 [Caenorhabditis remanei]
MLFPFILPSFSYQPNSFQDMLERVKASTSRLTSATRSPCFQRWSPILLILLTTVFILFGATCFYLFERDPQEMTVRKWYMNLAVERRQFARTISSRIFNDTRNLLIIIDREQTERVQVMLLQQTNQAVEEKLERLTPPPKFQVIVDEAGESKLTAA